MITCRALSKIYQQGTRRVVALDLVDLHVESQERVAILGRSGSGKSSLMNLLAGLDRPSNGSIEMNGRVLTSCNSRSLAKFRRHELGIVFQSFRLITHRTAFENVELPLVLGGVSRRERTSRVLEALEQVGLKDRAKHRPEELSGGEQQRVAIARAVVHRPSLLLADEPTGNLDFGTSSHVLELIEQIASQFKMTLLVITHDQHVANRLAQRTLRLSEGRIIHDSARDGEFVPVESAASHESRNEEPLG